MSAMTPIARPAKTTSQNKVFMNSNMGCSRQDCRRRACGGRLGLGNVAAARARFETATTKTYSFRPRQFLFSAQSADARILGMGDQVVGAQALGGAGRQREFPGGDAGLLAPAVGDRLGVELGLDLDVLVAGDRRALEHLDRERALMLVLDAVDTAVALLGARADEAGVGRVALLGLGGHAHEFVAPEEQV